ncbi:MAG TPA: type II CAAX endopeptidase family protein [Candidatus Acidoferrum sp.]|nr:type II CAAX endopeptidase family protein [Candidatus Acidoferrum sp.]
MVESVNPGAETAHGQPTKADPTATYGVGALLLIYLSTVGAYEFISTFREKFFGSLPGSIYYDTPIAILIVAAVALYHRPKLLALSRWVPRSVDILVATSVGLLIITTELALLHRKPDIRLVDPTFIPIVLVAPIAEELWVRGICLRSLRERQPAWLAILFVTVLSSLFHGNFWWALPAQLGLCVVYTALGNSLAASVILHMTINAVAITTGVPPHP